MDWNDSIPVFLILIGIIMFAFLMLVGLQNLDSQSSTCFGHGTITIDGQEKSVNISFHCEQSQEKVK
jgi:hypothetical protein